MKNAEVRFQTDNRSFKGMFKDEFQQISDVRSIDPVQYRTIWREQRERCKLVETSDFYYYTHFPKDFPEDKEDFPYIRHEVISLFFRSAVKEARVFGKSQRHLLDKGLQMIDSDPALDEIAKAGKFILSSSYDMVRAFTTINATPCQLPQFAFILPEQQRIALKRIVDFIGSEKDENFRETIRRYLPRWMHYPIPAPTDHIDASLDILKRLWSYTDREAHFLISPDRMPQGMPLHLVLKTAEMVEQAGNFDVGYFLRTWGVAEVLKMEKENFEKEEGKEIPFFHFILPGLVTGDIKIHTGNHYFDFSKAVGETMHKTFFMLQAQGEPQSRLANDFLQDLSRYYPDLLPAMLARSINAFSLSSYEIDQAVILRRLRQLNLPFAEAVLEQTEKLPERRLLTALEIEDSATRFIQYTGADESGSDFVPDIKSLIDSEDSYFFLMPLHRIGISQKNIKGEMEVDLDTNAEIVSAILKIRAGQISRSLPFQLNFSGEVESLNLDTLEGDPISQKATLVYRNLIAQSLRHEAERIRIKRQRQNGKLKIELPQPQFRTQGLNREQRIALYEAQRQQTLPEVRIKRRQLLTGQPSRNGLTEGEEKVEDRMLRITGMEMEQVERLLREGGARGIDAEQVIKKLQIALHLAQQNGYRLGKKISMDNYGGEQIDLRQVNWSLFGLSLRIYLQGISNGEFCLRGILNKKGNDMQTEYIKGLVRQIVKDAVSAS